MSDNPLHVRFRHGVGDCVYFACQLAFYHRLTNTRFKVDCARDKAIFFRAAGAEISHRRHLDLPSARWQHPNEHEKHLGGEPPFPLDKINKSLYNLAVPPLPSIPNSPEVWELLSHLTLPICKFVPESSWSVVQEFLSDLPRPILLLHPSGRSFQRTKSISKPVFDSLIDELQEQFSGSIMILDWNNWIQIPKRPGIHHLTNDWKPIDTQELIALQFLSDALIGIDSGPFHLSRLTGIPSLGVFPTERHHPVKFCLPSNNQANLICSSHYRKANPSLRYQFNLLEEPSKELSASQISKHALRLLEPPWLLPHKMQIVHDIVLQHWIQEAPIPLRQGLRKISKRFQTPRLLAIGSIKLAVHSPIKFSTLLIAAYCSNVNGSFYSFSNTVSHVECLEAMPKALHANLRIEKAPPPLKDLHGPIDALLLSGSDGKPLGKSECSQKLSTFCPLLHRLSVVILNSEERPDVKSLGWKVVKEKGNTYLLVR